MEIEGHPNLHPTISKFCHIPNIKEKSVYSGLLPVIQGVCELESGNFKTAAKHFLQVPFWSGSTEMWNFVAPVELAIYGTLCAMASVDRSEIKAKLLHNNDFKQFLELEPNVREALWAFHDSNFEKCMEILERQKVLFILNLAAVQIGFISP